MKLIKVTVTLGYVVAAMVACSSSNTSSNDNGADASTSGDSGGSSGGDSGTSSDAASCSASQAAPFGSSCVTCIEEKCQALVTGCTGSCSVCLLGCTACLTSCYDAGPVSDAGTYDAGDSAAPSCDKIKSGNCCSYAAVIDAGADCQRAVANNNESVCAALLSSTGNFLGFCR